jgi:hypothetical protein
MLDTERTAYPEWPQPASINAGAKIRRAIAAAVTRNIMRS